MAALQVLSASISTKPVWLRAPLTRLETIAERIHPPRVHRQKLDALRFIGDRVPLHQQVHPRFRNPIRYRVLHIGLHARIDVSRSRADRDYFLDLTLQDKWHERVDGEYHASYVGRHCLVQVLEKCAFLTDYIGESHKVCFSGLVCAIEDQVIDCTACDFRNLACGGAKGGVVGEVTLDEMDICKVIAFDLLLSGSEGAHNAYDDV